uniref:thioredoxin-disulfide reductase (NADPH) n=1 Tax=Scolopendra viridis TaxID=118503 RepID=A0A4D5R9N1_SCOVI
MAPITDKTEVELAVSRYISSNKVMIFSKSHCPFCHRVKELFSSLKVPFFALELDNLENGLQIQSILAEKSGQRTVPNVFVNGSHLGGCDKTLEAHKSGTLMSLLDLSKPNKFDYDLIVIGGGSGGLAASKEAAILGKKVAVLDFVKSSPRGTTWGLGGTCVNVGCIPKKLMHQSGLLGKALSDSEHFGWNVKTSNVNHTWNTLRDAVQNYIGSLNWNYRVKLRENKVDYINAYAEFAGPNTIKSIDKKGKERIITGETFILATGMRPKYPDIPGAKEYAISSDDLFSLPYPPGKTLCIGASYVSLECAGFLHELGFEVHVMVRSILLRGFDQQMAELVGAHMENEGIVFHREFVPTMIEEIEPGKPGTYKVTAQSSSGLTLEGEYNTILFAIGREACTKDLNLELVGVDVNPKNNKIPVVNEQTNVPYIYAVGDILDGKLELTPVAIQAGVLLAKRLYGESSEQCDYLNVPTTVFTPLEYSCVGYSEEDAVEKFGEENIEVYHNSFQPLEYTVPGRLRECYAKMICLKPENERVIGLHILSPNAGEIMQGFALPVKLGATKADFDSLIGIHPTIAEVFTTMNVTKRSGAAIENKGC